MIDDKVARVLGLQQDYAEAGELTREVLADRRRILGDDRRQMLAQFRSLDL